MRFTLPTAPLLPLVRSSANPADESAAALPSHSKNPNRVAAGRLNWLKRRGQTKDRHRRCARRR